MKFYSNLIYVYMCVKFPSGDLNSGLYSPLPPHTPQVLRARLVQCNNYYMGVVISIIKNTLS